MKEILLIFSLCMLVFCIKHEIRNRDSTNFRENANSKAFPFTANVLDIKIVHITEGPFTPTHTYKWEDFLKRNKHCTIVAGFDSGWLVSTVLTEVVGEENPLKVGDSIDFIVHSPAKLGIHNDSLPEMHSFELIADLNDSANVVFDLHPIFEKE